MLAMLVIGAAPAYADAAEPGNYESEVTRVDPQPVGVTLSVAGGDSFLEVAVDLGHEVLVPGYNGEPYVRIDPDGTVWVNEDSPTPYINEDRFGGVDIPSNADGKGDPRWTRVGSGGRYAWHDHRTHWMSTDRPPNVAGDVRQVVFPWKLPMVIDGQDVSVEGQLEWLPSRSPAVPLLIGVLALLPLAAWRRRPAVVALYIVLVAGLAIGVAVAQNAGTPAAARGLPVRVFFPAVALASGIAGLALRSHEVRAAWAQLIGSLSLLAWAFTALDTLSRPVLPSPLAPGAERIAVAAVLWAGLGALAWWAVGFVGRLRPTT